MNTLNLIEIHQGEFRKNLSTITQLIGIRKLDSDLELWLNQNFGVNSVWYQETKKLCITGVEEAWLCNREGGGIRYGRIFKPADDLASFSVDVVEMENIAGP